MKKTFQALALTLAMFAATATHNAIASNHGAAMERSPATCLIVPCGYIGTCRKCPVPPQFRSEW